MGPDDLGTFVSVDPSQAVQGHGPFSAAHFRRGPGTGDVTDAGVQGLQLSHVLQAETHVALETVTVYTVSDKCYLLFISYKFVKDLLAITFLLLVFSN